MEPKFKIDDQVQVPVDRSQHMINVSGRVMRVTEVAILEKKWSQWLRMWLPPKIMYYTELLDDGKSPKRIPDLRFWEEELELVKEGKN